jgi:cytochrome P450
MATAEQTTTMERYGGSVDVFGNLGGTLHEALREVAGTGPVAWDTSTGAVVVFRHRDVEALARDPRLAGVGLTFFDVMGITDGPLRDWYAGLMFTNDGTVHRRLRSLVASAFTPRAAESWRQTAAALADDAMAGAEGEAGGVDLVERFARLPTRVMCRLLGVPDGDVARFAAWLDALSPIFLIMTPEQIDAATGAIVDLLGYVDDLARRRRDDPGTDLITALLAAEDEGQRLSHDEVVQTVANLLVAGHDTTMSQIGCSLWSVLAHQPEMLRTKADLSLLGSLTSETIRLEPTIPIIPRTALESLPMEGYEIPAGAMVLLCSATANRDPATWQDPDHFDAGRFAKPGVPRVLTFGAGPHYCLGAALARVTLEECLRAVLTVDGWFELAEPPAEIPWRVLLGRSPERLLVRRRDR